MSLDYEYGINTGNRFLNFVDHDEDPDDFIANQTEPAEKPKKTAKDSKTVTATKKTTTKPSTTTATSVSATTKTNKENVTGKSSNNEQRRQQTTALGDNNQQPRGDSARGGRGFGRRGGGSAGQDRPAYEGGRGGGQQRSQRFNKFEGQQASNESGWTEQGGNNTWTNESGNDSQPSGGFRGRGRGRGRGNYEGGRGSYEGGRGNYEGGRGGGRGRGRGRGNYGNRSFEEGSQQQQEQQQQPPQQQQASEWQPNESNVDNARPQTAGQEFEGDATNQERPFEPSNQRGGRGHFRSRTFHNNRNFTNNRSNQYDREGGQEESRQTRRQHDRQPRSFVSGVKPVEKRGGEGPHNWGNPTEIPEEAVATDEQAEATGEQIPPVSKDWSQQVDEAEKQMTLDEYKKQVEAKKRANQEKLPQLNPRTANEGVDPKEFKDFEQKYRKKNENEGDDEEEVEEEDEENEDEEENDDDQQTSGKKKIINIPLFFKPIDNSRGGPRRGSGRFRPNRDEQTRSKSPSQQTGEYQPNEQQSRPFRGGSRPGSGRGEYRRSYGNSNRGSRGGYNRSSANSYTPDFGNTVDFPTLAK